MKKIFSLILTLCFITWLLPLSTWADEGHIFGDWETYAYESCTTSGTERRECEGCGYYEYRIIEATGHDLGDWYETVSYDFCPVGHYESRDCYNCGYYETRHVEGFDHNFMEWTTVTENYFCTITTYEYRGCNYCGFEEMRNYSVTKNEHEFGEWEKHTSPDCVTPGSDIRYCKNCDYYEYQLTYSSIGHDMSEWEEYYITDCNHTYLYISECANCSYYQIKGSAKGHSPGDWYEEFEATCEQPGEERRYCDDCDYYESREIPATGHDLSCEYTVIDPTCTSEGEDRVECSYCLYYETYITEALEHELDYYYDYVEATCEYPGIERWECWNCSYFENVETSALGHDYGEWYIFEDATCTRPGEERRNCLRCGWYYIYESNIIPANGHTLEYCYTMIEPSCTEPGEDRNECLYCNYYEVVITQPVGHDYGDWYITKSPTCTLPGIKQRDCYNCYVWETEEVPANGHTVVVDKGYSPTCTKTGLTDGSHCSVCKTVLVLQNAISATGHKYTTTVTRPTCTESGYTTYICHCGDIYTSDYVSAFGHTEVIDKAVAPTCTATGLTEGKHCSVCGKVLVTQTVIPATGHSYTSVATKPTCTEQGYTTHTCHCGSSYVDSYIRPNGHTMSDWYISKSPTCTVNGAQRRDCDFCDYYETGVAVAPGHTEVIDKAVAPTCTETGLTEGKHCETCGEVLVAQKVVDALGHDEVIDEAVAPTCTETGLTEGKHCSVCGEVLVAQKVVDALGHDEVIDEAVAPTCTETGLTEGKHCETCGEVLVAQKVVDALGHSCGDWYQTIAPMCSANGEVRRDCGNCEYYELDEIESYGPVVVIDKAIAPTCVETGLTEGEHCSECGEILVFQKIIPALGHTEVIDKAVAPTCTQTGLTEGKHCGTCDEILVAQKVVDVLGHEWNDGAITVEPTEETEGQILYTCRICDTTKTSVVPTLDHVHNYITEIIEPTCVKDGFTINTCRCGNSYNSDFVKALGHSEVIDEAVAPTCTETGLTEGKHCETCGEVLVEQKAVEALGHDYDSVIKHPTCTEDGYTTYTCKRCEYSYTDNEPSWGHSLAGGNITVIPTETTEGEITLYCWNCGKGYETFSIPVLSEKDYILTVTTAPSCENEGAGRYYWRAEFDIGPFGFDAVLPAIGHIYGEWYVVEDAVCSIPGLELRDCINCDHYEDREFYTDEDHKHEAEVIEPTCTEQGCIKYVCSVCGDYYVDEYLPPLDHTPSEWVTVVEPEIGVEGLKEQHCADCGELLDIETIPALQPTYILGDVTGDGVINQYDYICVKRHCMGTFSIEESSLTAADITGDGKVDQYDYIYIKRHCMGTYTIG